MPVSSYETVTESKNPAPEHRCGVFRFWPVEAVEVQPEVIAVRRRDDLDRVDDRVVVGARRAVDQVAGQEADFQAVVVADDLTRIGQAAHATDRRIGGVVILVADVGQILAPPVAERIDTTVKGGLG